MSKKLPNGDHNSNKFTARGFITYATVTDTYGHITSVQESSAANGPRCWLFTKDQKGESAIIHLGQLQSVSPHLDPAQARRIAKALLKFADTSNARWGKPSPAKRKGKAK